MKTLRLIGTVIGGIALVAGLFVCSLAISFGSTTLQLKWRQYFAPKFESVETDIYRENKSYVEGTVRDLREMRVEYEKATDAHKSALRSLILQRSRELNYERLPSDLQAFLTELEQ